MKRLLVGSLFLISLPTFAARTVTGYGEASMYSRSGCGVDLTGLAQAKAQINARTQCGSQAIESSDYVYAHYNLNNAQYGWTCRTVAHAEFRCL